jgi:toxin ParE1/3/4
MARGVVSSVAQADTAVIIRKLAAKAGRRVAADYAASIEALYDRLTVHPDSGAPRPAFGRYVRIGLVSPYVEAYRHVPGSDLGAYSRRSRQPSHHAQASWRRFVTQGRQDELAHMLLQYVGAESPPYELTPEEAADVAASMAEAERGEFATDEEVRSMWAKHGL